MRTLQQYFEENCARQVIDHALRADIAPDGTVSFYIHPQNVDGDTLNFVVDGNQLLAKYAVDDFKAAAIANPIPDDVLAIMAADRAKTEQAQ